MGRHVFSCLSLLLSTTVLNDEVTPATKYSTLSNLDCGITCGIW